MHVDPLLPTLVVIALSIFVVGIVLRLLRQPHLIGYLLVGVILGPAGLAVLSDVESIAHIGAIGVMLLLFFIGMEISPQELAKEWKVAIVGTLLQIVISVAAVMAMGEWLGWPVSRSVLLGFVVSLSSTAVVLKLLQETDEIKTSVGKKVTGVLLMQDLAIVPMLIVLGLLAGNTAQSGAILLQLVGGGFILGLTIWMIRRGGISMPFSEKIRKDHEIQVFAALVSCLGFGLLTGLMELSTALGAFMGGMIVNQAKETDWVQHSLEPFRIVFVALFFVSIGLLIDLNFLMQHWWKAGLLIIFVIVINTGINAVTLRMLSVSWKESIYAGAMLSQIGEFSFVLAAVGKQSGIIEDYAYQMTVIIIALGLLVSPAWIALFRRTLGLQGKSGESGLVT